MLMLQTFQDKSAECSRGISYSLLSLAEEERYTSFYHAVYAESGALPKWRPSPPTFHFDTSRRQATTDSRSDEFMHFSP